MISAPRENLQMGMHKSVRCSERNAFSDLRCAICKFSLVMEVSIILSNLMSNVFFIFIFISNSFIYVHALLDSITQEL